MFSGLKQHPSVVNALKQYEMLSSRDQAALKVLSLVVLVLLLYFFMWVPAHSFMSQSQQSLESARELLALVQENKQLLAQSNQQAQSGSVPALDSQQLVSSVTNLAKRHGLVLKRFEPSGERELKVWLEDASFDKMVAWLGDLKKNLGVTAEQVSVEKEDAEGLVSARLTLAS